MPAAIPNRVFRRFEFDSRDASVQRSRIGILLLLLMLAASAYAQTEQVSLPQNPGSVPSGPATKEVVRLTLRNAISMGIRYNLGSIESGENTRIARGQRLRALSSLLPQVS